MWMTEYEISRSFMRATKFKEQIRILSELNACSEEDIINVLRKSSNVSNDFLDEVLNKKKRGAAPSKELQESKQLDEISLLREEVRKAYTLCIELEEENRRLSHDVILHLKDLVYHLVGISR
jgi:hypothetical protein